MVGAVGSVGTLVGALGSVGTLVGAVGGVIIRAGDLVIDNSARGRLNRLSDALQS